MIEKFLLNENMLTFICSGLPWELARGTLRLSTSYMTSEDEIDRAVDLLVDAIERQLNVDVGLD